MNVSEALSWASSFLKKEEMEPRAAEIVMGHVLGMRRSEMLSKLDRPLDDSEEERFRKLVEQHATGEPVQYVIGTEEFFGRSFVVNREVLIPRPETEELIVAVLDRITAHFPNRAVPVKVIDIGTGSGAIAVTLKLENPELVVTGADIAEASLDVASENGRRLHAEVRWMRGDLLQPFIADGERFDVIVSNPPYIPEREVETLSQTVREHEPVRALFGGEDGYLFYRRLMEEIPRVIGEQALVAFEVGYDQAQTVANMLEETFGERIEVEIITDINGKERIITGWIK